MPRLFPQQFDLRFLDGPRAKQFARPEDAFQQLLGDALKEMAGPYAHISPTRGRDGSIDAILLEGAQLSGPFEHLPTPLIVECKTHDDEAKGIDRNVLGEWASLKRKLEANAQAGWKDLFEPWKQARGYAYCLSAHIKNEQLRINLMASIQQFFAALPTDQRPPINSFRVIDWNDLRQWLDASPRVSDAWLGVKLDLILDHPTYLRRLSGFREYLLPAQLEFVPPSTDSPFHPLRVLGDLEAAKENHGVLLLGVGGIGKTRTAIEVATLAVNAGWRVLHVLPDEPGVETEDLAEIVLPYRDSRALLVFDYIDQMQRLDLGSIRRSLIPEACERGIQLRLLANSRPGWMALTNSERDSLFSVTELRPTDLHKEQLVRTMSARIAPIASSQIGFDEVVRLCGTRAIIALLIARELENRARANSLKGFHTTDFRSGDLIQWLRRRLQENKLSVARAEVTLSPTRPDPSMVASAAVLVCASETNENLVIAAKLAYEQLGWPNAAADAQYLVDILVKLGWLEVHKILLATAHDVVADEVLDQTIHANSLVFESEFTAVLSLAFGVHRGLGRLATASRRVLGTLKDESSVQALRDFLRRWLEVHAVALGEVLQAGDPDPTSYALGAILSGPPWDASAIEQWDELVLPWLNAHSTKEEARHLLYKGLRNVPANQSALITPALAWLTAHSTAIFATFVIKPLLERTDLSIAEAQQARGFGITWLELHHKTLEAKFVLRPLLERTDLSIAEAEQARGFGLSWLELHHKTLGFPFVLKPLLERTDLSSTEAEQARAFGLSWLELHRKTLEAQSVLQPLLERTDLSSAEAEQARRFGLSWLELHHKTLGFPFVLKPLRERTDLSSAETEQARGLGLSWLELHHKTLEAQFALKPLLERTDLSSAEAQQVRGFALIWLEQHHSTLEARYVLYPLLERGDLPTPEAEQSRGFALMWLGQHHNALEAGLVLESLLRRSDLSSAEAEQAIQFSLSWLEQHHSSLGAGSVIAPLLSQSKLKSDPARLVIRDAFRWLRLFHTERQADYVLLRLFRRHEVSIENRAQLLSAGVQRLRQSLLDDAASHLLRSCLQYRIDDDVIQGEILSIAVVWLDLHPENLAGDYVWNRVLRYRPNLVNDSDWSKVAQHALLWLRRKPLNDKGVDQTTNSLLMRWHLLEPADREYVLNLAIELLGTDLNPEGLRRMVASLEYILRSLSEDNPLKRQVQDALR